MDDFRKMAERQALRLGFRPRPLKVKRIIAEDVGKYFVIGPSGSPNRLVTSEEFHQIPLAEIKGWWQVNEFDITIFE